MDSEILSGLEDHIPGIQKVSNDDELDVLLAGLNLSDRLAKIRACKNLIKHAASIGSAVSSTSASIGSAVSSTSATIPKRSTTIPKPRLNPPRKWKPLVTLPSDLEGRPTSFYGKFISPQCKAINESSLFVEKNMPIAEPENPDKNVASERDAVAKLLLPEAFLLPEIADDENKLSDMEVNLTPSLCRASKRAKTLTDDIDVDGVGQDQKPVEESEDKMDVDEVVAADKISIKRQGEDESIAEDDKVDAKDKSSSESAESEDGSKGKREDESESSDEGDDNSMAGGEKPQPRRSQRQRHPVTRFHVATPRKSSSRKLSKRSHSRSSNPKHLEESMPPRINLTYEPPRHFAPSVPLFAADGERKCDFIWSTYYEPDVKEWFQKVIDMTKPPPQKDSPIHSTTFHQFSEMTVNEVQELISQKVLVLSQRPKHLRWDLGSLQLFGNLNELRIMHDASLAKGGDANEVHVQASLKEFFTSSKILNALELPGFDLPPVQLATDMAALRSLKNIPNCFSKVYPVDDMSFGLAGKTGAMHKVHVDRSGFVTKVDVHHGGKWWIVGIPSDEKEGCASADAYGNDLSQNSNLDRGYTWYGIYLEAGTSIIMPPGTLHIVFTTADCLCTGNETFTRSTMAKTVFMIYHTLAESAFITNTSIANEFLLLLQIALFWKSELVENEEEYFNDIKTNESLGHLPNLLRWDDAINVLTLLNFVDLAWVLTPIRYVGHSKEKMPLTYAFAKEAARNLRSWIYSNFSLALRNNDEGVDEDDRVCSLSHMSEQYLIQNARLLVRHVSHSYENGYLSENISTTPGQEKRVTSRMVEQAIEADLCQVDGNFDRLWKESIKLEKPALDKVADIRESSGNLESRIIQMIQNELDGLVWDHLGRSYAWPEPANGYHFVLKRAVKGGQGAEDKDGEEEGEVTQEEDE
ncbi:hypothetical protein BDP27DRAFT_1371013 [Rhodocollybia butyracea]|uniref:JmjC domain-containing protein n=1 Tax=Rhodocollybia butyracea TaxID=206335 RepID=A0A9P5PCW6_9AGAR|nr:hypothetical protein BDP27DRAFT_1371013 [Rhodocollybia butyracea]